MKKEKRIGKSEKKLRIFALFCKKNVVKNITPVIIKNKPVTIYEIGFVKYVASSRFIITIAGEGFLFVVLFIIRLL